MFETKTTLAASDSKPWRVKPLARDQFGRRGEARNTIHPELFLAMSDDPLTLF
jgi:hypothetical protein